MTDWQVRALRMRREGNTLAFIAGQIARTFPVKQVDVIAFLLKEEREREAKKGETP